MCRPSIKISLAVPVYVEMVLSWFLSPIKLYVPSVDNLLERAMSAEACSAYLCQIFALKLLIMFATIMSLIFGIHDFVTLTLVA